MRENDQDTSRYFQAISRLFLENRGAPFFLSSHELESIKEWRKLGIPLPIVLEGIKDCFAAHVKKPGRKRKMLSLSLCNPFVLRGYEAHKERQVGRQGQTFLRENRREELKKAAEGFLTSFPDRFWEIQRILSRVLNLITQGAEEELFEDLENELEGIILGAASESERALVQKEVKAEFGVGNAQEQERIRDLKLIKHIREKYKIPHISLYYY